MRTRVLLNGAILNQAIKERKKESEELKEKSKEVADILDFMKTIRDEGHELLEVKGTRYWDHGEEIKYYIFRLKNETCFDDGYGLIDAGEIQVLLNDEQIKNINAFLNKTIRIQIDDFLWGGTQQWKRSIGVTRARFYLN